jgi:tryptophan-rich sensory protein
MKAMKLIASLVISFAAGAAGSLATIPNIPSWYAELEKPFLNPPNFVFGPVWTALYLLIAISLYLVWTRKSTKSKASAYWVFAVQMVLNALWSFVFFGLHMPELAIAVIIVLLAAIVATIVLFYRFSKPAAYFLVPYLLWVGFATYLTIGVAVLN